MVFKEIIFNLVKYTETIFKMVKYFNFISANLRNVILSSHGSQSSLGRLVHVYLPQDECTSFLLISEMSICFVFFCLL